MTTPPQGPADNYTVAGSASARRDADKLPLKIRQAVDTFILVELSRNPKRVGHPLHKPYEGLWSARRGTYRVIYSIDETKRQVIVVAVRGRADAYRPGASPGS